MILLLIHKILNLLTVRPCTHKKTLIRLVDQQMLNLLQTNNSTMLMHRLSILLNSSLVTSLLLHQRVMPPHLRIWVRGIRRFMMRDRHCQVKEGHRKVNINHIRGQDPPKDRVVWELRVRRREVQLIFTGRVLLIEKARDRY